MRTHGVNQAFRFVEGIWLNRKSRQIRNIFRKRAILRHTCTTRSDLPSYISTMIIPPLLQYQHEVGICGVARVVQCNVIYLLSYLPVNFLSSESIVIIHPSRYFNNASQPS